jgi:leucyl-tRNA synthetase
MKKYNYKKIEKKWQDIWQKTNASKIDKDDETKEKFYVLDMFPYPSGTGLHMGHTESYTASDVIYRFKKLQGFNVLHPQGFDSFGLPAENYAIKTGINPAQTTQENMANYINQMQSLGFAYDFSEQAVTSSPEYYKWTQWIFGNFYENGLVYKKTSKTNWCDSCQTVIANEQVVEGKCERCGTEIEQKEVPSWFFKITDFAQELIDDLDKVDWPEYTKKNQRNWIGRSEGATVKFEIKNSNEKLVTNIEVFTTRVDTIFGCTYLVVAPESEILKQVQDDIINYDEVKEYLDKAKNKTEMERIEAKEKTGVKIDGLMAVNPFNNEEVPVFVADYVIGSYGTGAVMAVPAHDERDFEFAKKYDLPIKEVIQNSKFKIQNYNLKSKVEEIFTEDGVLVDSGEFSKLTSQEAREKMTAWLEENNLGKKQINYRLRDWSISRQRYWGCPIPIVYSPEGEPQLIPEKYLPWKLPEDVDFVPTGVSPLAKSEELKKRVEDIFGKGWVAEYDTMDTFVDSSWYFLRYPDANNDKEFCSKARLKQWLPVDVYIGGAEHTYMHLLFARFFTKALNKIGIIDFTEPFLKLRHQGMVLDKNGDKMSKSKGNVINPDDMIERFGADSVRTYMLFVAPLEDAVMWNENNIVGITRFMEKIWKVFDEKELVDCGGGCDNIPKELPILLHKTIKKVTQDIETLNFNTAISQMMIFINGVSKYDKLPKTGMEKFLILLAPFTPHMAEEIWQENLGHDKSIFVEKWPEFKEALTKDEEIELVIQINGKVRDKVNVSANISEEDAKKLALESKKVKKYIEGKELKKVIYVRGKLISIVV